MPDFGRWTSGGGDPSINEVNRTDRFLDALAAEQPVYSTDPGEAELAYLLAGWRDDIRQPSPTATLTRREAVEALDRGLASRHHSRMPMAVVGSIAAAVLCLGGFGAVVYGSGPGDGLYGLRTMMFGEQSQVRDDRVVLAAQTQLAEVQQLIDKGDWTQAQDKLQAITTTVRTVGDEQRKQELQQQVDRLAVKVETRDPNAEPPPAPAPMQESAAATSGETTMSETTPSGTAPSGTAPSGSVPSETPATTPSATSAPFAPPSATPTTAPAPTPTTTARASTSATTAPSTTSTTSTATTPTTGAQATTPTTTAPSATLTQQRVVPTSAPSTSVPQTPASAAQETSAAVPQPTPSAVPQPTPSAVPQPTTTTVSP
jgi:hypothetical protein